MKMIGMMLLGLVPGVLNFVSKWQQAAYNARVQLTAIRIGGDTEKALPVARALVYYLEHHPSSGRWSPPEDAPEFGFPRPAPRNLTPCCPISSSTVWKPGTGGRTAEMALCFM